MGSRARRAGVQSYFESGDDAWEQRYSGGDMEACMYFDRQRIALRQLRRHVPPGGLVLDAGCGPGYLSVALEQAGFRVISCDLALRMARSTRDRRRDDRVIVADLDQPPFPAGQFDAIVLIGVISYVTDVPALLDRIRWLLKPDGVLVLSSANRNILLNAVGGKLSTTLYRLGAKRPEPTARGVFFTATCNYYRASEFNALVTSSGYRLLENETIGFGRFKVLQRHLFPERLEVLFSRALSRLTRAPSLRKLGDYAFNNIACFRPVASETCGG